MFATPDNLARGAVVVDGRRFTISLRSELLYADGPSWFRHQAERQLDLAEAARRDGDEGLANEREATARKITAFAERTYRVRHPDMGVGVCNRSELSPWSVDDTPEAMLSYARSLVEFGRPPSADDADFLLLGDEAELLLVERLRPQSRFARPFRATIVEPAEIQRRLAQLP